MEFVAHFRATSCSRADFAARDAHSRLRLSSKNIASSISNPSENRKTTSARLSKDVASRRLKDPDPAQIFASVSTILEAILEARARNLRAGLATSLDDEALHLNVPSVQFLLQNTIVSTVHSLLDQWQTVITTF